MNMLRRSGVPLGHIGLGDAYEEAFRRLESADELLAAIAPDKWVQISGSPTVHAELPAPEAAEPLALKAYDDARDRVADMVGQAIVNSELDVYYTDPETGSTMLCVDRGMFARHASLVPGLGLTNFVDSLGRPVPDAGSLLVYLTGDQFEKWLAKVVSSNRPKHISDEDLCAAYREHVEQITSAGQASEDDDLEAMQKKFPRVSRERVRALRRALAPEEWKLPGKRKGMRG